MSLCLSFTSLLLLTPSFLAWEKPAIFIKAVETKKEFYSKFEAWHIPRFDSTGLMVFWLGVSDPDYGVFNCGSLGTPLLASNSVT
mmetsp:Transcript_19087/g.36165  ORF Transcript_19087/g.36165 Transcript_19087/m.36165 type:complete len:85 (+) Transcript_19087:120-374(+)|eukprot:scaffold36148_cov206-Amphora_coffeaeformis.AAC.1